MDRPASAGFFYCSAVGAIRKDARGAAVAVAAAATVSEAAITRMVDHGCACGILKERGKGICTSLKTRPGGTEHTTPQSSPTRPK